MAFTFCCNTCGSTEEIAWDDVIGIDPTDYEQDCECCGISVCASCAREDLDVFPLCEPCAREYEEELLQLQFEQPEAVEAENATGVSKWGNPVVSE